MNRSGFPLAASPLTLEVGKHDLTRPSQSLLNSQKVSEDPAGSSPSKLLPVAHHHLSRVESSSSVSSLPGIHEVDEGDSEEGGEIARIHRPRLMSAETEASRMLPALDESAEGAARSRDSSAHSSQELSDAAGQGPSPSSLPHPSDSPKPLTLKGVLKHIRRGSRDIAHGLTGFARRGSSSLSGAESSEPAAPGAENGSPGATRRGRRKSSIFENVLRRVSIHRRDSAPNGRFATFVFGAGSKDNDDSYTDDEDGSHDGDVEKGGKRPDENGGHAGHGGGKKEEEVTLRLNPRSQVSLLVENLCVILSGLYGILLVVLGLVIPLSELFAFEGDHRFEIFYIYLYGVSIIFLTYVYLYLLRRNRLRTELVTRTLSRSMSWTRNWAKSWMPEDNQRSSRRKRMVSLDESNHHTGTFYLRLGVLGFGIGSMIHSGLSFGKFFGSITEGDCARGTDLMLKPLFHLCFTFFQLYFVFMNSKMCIHRYKVVARFGLIHMAATNICVWIRSIVVETLHEIHHSHHLEEHAADSHGHENGPHAQGPVHDHGAAHGNASRLQETLDPAKGLRDYGTNLSLVTVGRKLLAATAAGNVSRKGLLEITCSWNNMMGNAVDKAGPYLYPCTIEYSLMCAGILYVMWNNVGSKPRRRTVSQIEEEESDRKHQRMSVDCTSSSRGLFTGIFLTVAAIISVIAFYVMIEQPHLEGRAMLLTHLSETFIYLLTLFAIGMACFKMRKLHFHADHESDMEEVLIIIAYTGLLMFNIFSVVAASLSPGDGAALTIISNITMMIQSAAQTIFMLAGDRMSSKSVQQERKKPGREYVTFLLLCNFAMWVINTFETQKPEHNPLQVHFYGPEAWSIFSHISVPLGIYYRFHSTVCLSNIWKNAWKASKHAASHH